MKAYTREQMIQCYKDAINNVGQYIQNWREPMPTAEKYVDSLDAKFEDQQVVGMGSFPADPIDVFEAPSFPNFDGVTKDDFEHIEIKMVHHKEVYTPSLFEIPSQPTIGIAVDCGSVNGRNPGIFEYRLVDIATKKVIKNVVISGDSTNNISEFLAVVDGIRYVVENSLDLIVYSDSRTAISWFKKKKCKTKFIVQDLEQQREILSAEKFLQVGYNVRVTFWNHKYFTENPADYNRK